MTSRDQLRAQPGDPQSPPRVSGDERFVPASHVLVIDRQVSHPAFRLWCVLHRLWFLHEPPVTVIISNRAPEQLDQRILLRMYQRAFAGEILPISAEDYRRSGARTRPA